MLIGDLMIFKYLISIHLINFVTMSNSYIINWRVEVNYLPCQDIDVITFWSNVTNDSIFMKHYENPEHEFNMRDICLLSEIWLSKGFKQFIVISNDTVNCPAPIRTIQHDISSNKIYNEWFLLDLNSVSETVLYITNDMFPDNEMSIICHNTFIYSKKEIDFFDSIYFESLRLMHTFDNYQVPKNQPLYGPQFITLENAKQLLRMFKGRNLDYNRFSFMLLLGAWESLNTGNISIEDFIPYYITNIISDELALELNITKSIFYSMLNLNIKLDVNNFNYYAKHISQNLPFMKLDEL